MCPDPSTAPVHEANLKVPEVEQTKGESVLNLNLKEFIMNKTSQPELELQVVELGDAKELTMGIPAPVFAEENPLVQGKLI